MKTILVVANETLGGAHADRRRQGAAPREGDARVVVCVPAATQPKHGNVIYDEAVLDAAQVRIDLARRVLRERGHRRGRRRRRPRPLHRDDGRRRRAPARTRSSSRPTRRPSSGWLRRDLIERIEEATRPAGRARRRRPRRRGPARSTSRSSSPTAPPRRRPARAAQGQGRRASASTCFIVVVPQEGGDGPRRARRARASAQVLDRVRAAGLVAAGMIGDPDPYTATMNALAVLPRRRHRHLHAARDPLGLAARRPHRARAERDAQAGRARRGRAQPPTSARPPDGGHGSRLPHARTTHGDHHGPPRGEPQLAGRARSCSGCCCSSSARSWCSGPSSRPTSSSGSCNGRRVAGRRARAARSSWRGSTPRSCCRRR